MLLPALPNPVAVRIAKRFGSRHHRGYVWGKLGADPLYRAVWEELRASPLPLLDLGCGLGLLAFYLRENGWRPAISGIDFDGQKVSLATRAAAGGNAYHGLDFREGDVRQSAGWPPSMGNVVLGDVLHYLPAVDQGALLSDVARRVPPGGAVLIRTALRDGSWRYRATYAEEVFMRAVGWMRTTRIVFPTLAEVTDSFREAGGFTEEVRPLWERTPFNSHLLVFRRRVEGVKKNHHPAAGRLTRQSQDPGVGAEGVGRTTPS